MPDTEEEEFPLGVLPPVVFISSVKTSGDEIKFTLKSGCTFNIQSGKPDRSSKSLLWE